MNWSTFFKIVLVETIIRIIGLFFCFFIRVEGGSQTVGMFILALLILFCFTIIFEVFLFCLSFLIFKKVNLLYKIIGVNISIIAVMFVHTYGYTMGNLIKMGSFDVKILILLLFIFNTSAILSLGIFFKKI